MESKVLFHVNHLQGWEQTLANIENLIEDIGEENLLIEVVANGEGVNLFKRNSDERSPRWTAMIRELSYEKVKFVLCSNSLKANNINKDCLPGYLAVVPAGITELVMKQREGYVYIKP